MTDAASPAISVTWNATDRKTWDRLLAMVPFAAYQQDFVYGETMARSGLTVQRARIDLDGEAVAIAQLQQRRIFGRLTFSLLMLGPVWLRDDLGHHEKAAAISALARTLPGSGQPVCLIMPGDADVAAFELLRAPRIMSSYHTALISLQQDEHQLRANLDQKWRNRLNASHHYPLTTTVLPENPSAYQWLLDAETVQRKRARYQAVPVTMVSAYQTEGGRGRVLALDATLDSVKVAGVLFLIHGAHATYHIGWSSPDGKAVSAHNHLLWAAFRRLKARGIRTVDLGGMTTDRSDGIARFKLGTGAQPVSQGGVFLLRPRWR